MISDTTQYCTFRVANLLLGIEVQQVQEVIRCQTMTRVPLASRSVTGLINLRGQIVTAIDLRERLGLPSRTSTKPPMNVVIRDGDEAVSLLVDEIGEVLEVEEDLFELAPTTIPSAVRSMIDGAFKLPNQLLLVLNTHQALADPATRSLAEV